MQQQESYYKSKSGPQLFCQSWTVESPKAHVLVTHGQGEHSESYLRLAKALNENQISVHGWDLRGHGRSEGKRGYVSDFSDYVADFVEISNWCQKSLSNDAPLFYLAHSMGGLINLRAMADKNFDTASPQALLLSSPLLGLTLPVPKAKKKMAEWAGAYLPTITLGNEISPESLTSDPSVLSEYLKDSYRHAKVSPAVFLGIEKSIKIVNDQSYNLKTPVLMQLSGLDSVVCTKSSLDFLKNVGSPKKSFVYEGSRHEIFNDCERQKVFDDLNKYINRELGVK